MGGGPVITTSLSHLSLHNKSPAPNSYPATTPTSKMEITTLLSTHKPDLSSYESLYKDLHQHPGLSLQENLAASTAASHLRSLPDFDVRTNIGGTGLVGILKNGNGKTVLLRADT